MSHDSERNTPILRLDLKRADAAELVKGDRALLNCPFVRALGSSSTDVLGKGVVRRYPDKVVVFQQNDPGGSLFLVLAGEARLFARKHTDTVELGFVHKGDVLGEGEFLSGCGVRSASAVACGQLDLVEFTKEALSSGAGLPAALHRTLGEVATNRTAKLDEMADFLNRW